MVPSSPVEQTVRVMVDPTAISALVSSSADDKQYTEELLREALPMLHPAARHGNIMRLLGVVREGAYVTTLILERPSEGSLSTHIRTLLTSPDGLFCVEGRVPFLYVLWYGLEQRPDFQNKMFFAPCS